MSTLREAAQQALEALDWIGCSPEGYDQMCADRDRAQEALRTALAQEEQEPVAKMILEALEIGYDSAQAEAAQYHAAMAGYRPERHAQMDADVQKIAAAITAVKAALAQEEQEQEPVAWAYEVATTVRDGKGARWESRITEYEPKVPVGMIRNLTPLYTHPPRRTGLPHCEHSCEAQAFLIEIRRLKAELAAEREAILSILDEHCRSVDVREAVEIIKARGKT